MLRWGQVDPSRRGDGMLLNHHSELSAEWKNMKISEGLSNSKKIVLNMKKLSNVGVDLTLRQRGKKQRHGQNEQQILWI